MELVVQKDNNKRVQIFASKLERTIWIYHFLCNFYEFKTILYIKTNKEKNRCVYVTNILTYIVFKNLYPQLLMKCHIHCQNICAKVWFVIMKNLYKLDCFLGKCERNCQITDIKNDLGNKVMSETNINYS